MICEEIELLVLYLADPSDGEQVNNHARVHNLPELRLLVQRDPTAQARDRRQGRVQEEGLLGRQLGCWTEGGLRHGRS